MIIDQEKVKASIDRLIQNNNEPILYIRGPSPEIERAAFTYPSSIVFGLTPAQKFYGMGKMATWLDKQKINSIINEMDCLVRIIAPGYVNKTPNKKTKGLVKLLQKSVDRTNKVINEKSLNRLYSWLQDDKSENYSLKNYCSVISLKFLEKNEIPIDSYVSGQLERIDNSIIPI